MNYQHEKYSNIYAAGAAVSVTAPWQTPVAVGVPRNGLPAEIMASIGAHNIARQVRGEKPDQERGVGDVPGVYVMDTGKSGVMILSDKLLPPRKHELVIPGPEGHWAKVGFEKYYLWKMRHGHVGLP